MAYLDTSVVVAYYYPEALSLQAQDVLRQQAIPALSFLTEVEFASAVAKKVRQDELSRVDGNRILAKFTSHVDAGLYRMITVKKHHWQLAKGWISLMTTPLRTLDALHLAIASSEDLQLITMDRQLAKAAELLDLDVVLVA
jgi:hypothetical protein